MPRPVRQFAPGHVWHITHRCHQKDFLLKFQRDRKRWAYWLHQACRRHGLCVLNYIATSNHVHLMVRDRGKGEIPPALQLVQSRIAQEYNLRRGRRGAFWQDRYHATLVDTEGYLARCLVYIDLNMVRAGVVDHPCEWDVSGYQEIQSPPRRYRIIDQSALKELFGCNLERFRRDHADWIEERLRKGALHRDAFWSESLAVGTEAFVRRIRDEFGINTRQRKIHVEQGFAHLRENSGYYSPHFISEKPLLTAESRLLPGENFL